MGGGGATVYEHLGVWFTAVYKFDCFIMENERRCRNQKCLILQTIQGTRPDAR